MMPSAMGTPMLPPQPPLSPNMVSYEASYGSSSYPASPPGQSTKKRKQHCSFCTNHGKKILKNGHNCEYKDCPCLLCQLSTEAQAIMRKQQALWRSQNRLLARNDHFRALGQLCDKCRNHNEFYKKRGHKTACSGSILKLSVVNGREWGWRLLGPELLYENCDCSRCELTNRRRLLMKHQQRIRRANVTSKEFEEWLLTKNLEAYERYRMRRTAPVDLDSETVRSEDWWWVNHLEEFLEENKKIFWKDMRTDKTENEEDPDEPPDDDEASMAGVLNAVSNEIHDIPDRKKQDLHSGQTPSRVFLQATAANRHNLYPPMSPDSEAKLHSHFKKRSITPTNDDMLGSPQAMNFETNSTETNTAFNRLNLKTSKSSTPDSSVSNPLEPTISVKKEIPDDMWSGDSLNLKRKYEDIKNHNLFPSTSQLYLNSLSNSYAFNLNHSLNVSSHEPFSASHLSNSGETSSKSLRTGEKSDFEYNTELFNLNREKNFKTALDLEFKRRGSSSLMDDAASYPNPYQQNQFLQRPSLDNPQSFLRNMGSGALEELSIFSKMMFNRRLTDPLSSSNRSDETTPYYSLGSPYNTLHRPSVSSLRPSDNTGPTHSSPPIQPYPLRLVPSELRWPPSFLHFPPPGQFPLIPPDNLLPYHPVIFPNNRNL